MTSFIKLTDATTQLACYIDAEEMIVLSSRERSDLQKITAVFIRDWHDPIMVLEAPFQIKEKIEKLTLGDKLL